MLHLTYNRPVILLCLILTTIAAWYTTQLKFDHELENYFPKDDRALAFNEFFREQLEPDDNFLLVAIKSHRGIFDHSFLQEFQQLTLACKDLPHVVGVNALTNMGQLIKSPLGMLKIPLIHIRNPGQYASDSTKILRDERYVGRFISKDAKTLTIILKTESHLSQDQAQELNGRLFDLLGGYAFDSYHVAGKLNTQAFFVQKIQHEMRLYTVLSGLLVLLILTIIFRKFWPVVIAFSSVLIGLTLFLGILGMMGKPLNLMSSLFPTLMLVVGMSDVIHILSKYIDELEKGLPAREAMLVTIKEIGWATFLTSLTTAIGFGALLTSKITPIREFGVISAMGVFIAYTTVITFTTAMLVNFDRPQLVAAGNATRRWPDLMQSIYAYVKTRQPGILWISLLVFAGSMLGGSLLSTNTHLLSDIPEDDQPRADFQFFERELAGVRSFEMAVIAQNGHKINELEILREIEKVAQYLNGLAPIDGTYSTAMIYKSLNQIYGGGHYDQYRLPSSQEKIDAFEKMNANRQSIAFKVLMSDDKQYGRISAKIQDIGSSNIAELNKQINQWVSRNTDTEKVRFKITGTALLVDKNNDYLRKSLFNGLALAFFVVSLLMAILFRNIKMVVISLVPNIIPLLVAGAIMGIAGIELKASTSIIFTVAFGIAVDDTIHFLSKFKLSLNKGHTVDEAIKQTFSETGKALCLTTIILFFGFLILLFSDFNGTFYIGLLVSITLLSALFTDLTLLPVLLYRLFKKPKKPGDSKITPG